MTPILGGGGIEASVEKELLGHMPWGRWDPQTLRGHSEKSPKVVFGVVSQTSLVKQDSIKISDKFPSFCVAWLASSVTSVVAAATGGTD